jgi:hypothetical protein
VVYAKPPSIKVTPVSKLKNSATSQPQERREKKDRRHDSERRHQSTAVVVDRRKLQRREKVSRRRQIDPTTCERDYTDEEIEFMHALDRYKRASGRMFPTCSEMLEVIRGLGYQRVNEPGVTTCETPEAAPEAE